MVDLHHGGVFGESESLHSAELDQAPTKALGFSFEVLIAAASKGMASLAITTTMTQ